VASNYGDVPSPKTFGKANQENKKVMPLDDPPFPELKVISMSDLHFRRESIRVFVAVTRIDCQPTENNGRLAHFQTQRCLGKEHQPYQFIWLQRALPIFFRDPSRLQLL